MPSDLAWGSIVEPTGPAAVRTWIETNLARRDRFAHVRAATDQHRLDHHCTAYPTSGGSLLGVLTQAIGPGKILELGCGIGYSTLWLAYGAGPDARIEAVDRDPAHVALTLENLDAAGYGEQVTVTATEVDQRLADTEELVDLIFYDADLPSPERLDQLARVLRFGGLLISANLFLGQYDPALEGLDQVAAYRSRLLDDEDWSTAFAGDKALSIRR